MGYAAEEFPPAEEESSVPQRYSSIDRLAWGTIAADMGEAEKRDTISSQMFTNSRIQETLEHNEVPKQSSTAPRKYLLLNKNPLENPWNRALSERSPLWTRPSTRA